MLLHPQFDPVAFSVGPLSVRWYGLMYLVAFVQFILLGRYRIKTRPGLLSIEQLDDLLFYGMLGVIIGGRLGQVLFYEPTYFLANPLEIFAVWKGGMSFHGGFIGVLLAIGLWGRKLSLNWFDVTDFIAPLVPLGLAAGRVGNFINGELWGRVAEASLPWAMIFPQSGDMAPRHPSQLYHVGLEGLSLFIILWLFTAKPRPRAAASGVFLIGYGAFRFITEFFREPDHGIFGQSYTISMGQWLSLPMILAGVALVVFAYRKKPL
ncbi:prolipoprotein diacylglyceryl transferase [Ferribacterium limneticum]|uniref:prolipoprotein diacylglyceryl transferase n=1 Tax=Ferribacterium limneticum TaxID=76259 RepID=UPI001CFA092B|nr:prolipoprotein diacylglyceryl transferase [Ferribacterium limneticum]UCV28828.1 prolipoprotein diacylglyceryl transferase [Ferribacterium limneticum]UCV32746.1 prolipoprotein diacylglyceryl transferase [Ferribacterium limneticum]